MYRLARRLWSRELRVCAHKHTHTQKTNKWMWASWHIFHFEIKRFFKLMFSSLRMEQRIQLQFDIVCCQKGNGDSFRPNYISQNFNKMQTDRRFCAISKLLKTFKCEKCVSPVISKTKKHDSRSRFTFYNSFSRSRVNFLHSTWLILLFSGF